MNKVFFLLIYALAVSARAADPPSEPLDQAEKRLHQAQEKLNQSAREVAELSMQIYGHPLEEGLAFPVLARGRPLLGVNVGETDQEGGGVRIVSVSPGGPADKAGLKAGDVLVSVNGSEFKAGGRESPRQRVVQAMRSAKADTPVAVELRRDGKVLKLNVVPKATPDFDMDDFRGFKLGDNFSVFVGGHGGGFGSAEFLSLTPGLGHYFGTDKGLLVVKPPRDERMSLKEGDVVLDIDGRVPSNASHAYRIFSSYRPGETMKLHVMRDQKRLELPVEVPADTSRMSMRRFSADFDQAFPRGPVLSVKPDGDDEDF